jgi:hypothetical protein
MSKIKSATKHAEEIGILLLHGREGVIESDESLFRHLIQHERGVQFDALEAVIAYHQNVIDGCTEVIAKGEPAGAMQVAEWVAQVHCHAIDAIRKLAEGL